MDKVDLSLVPSVDLVRELSARFDSCIIAGMRIPDNKSGVEAFGRWFGNPFVCSGLAQDVSRNCLNTFHETGQAIDPVEGLGDNGS